MDYDQLVQTICSSTNLVRNTAVLVKDFVKDLPPLPFVAELFFATRYIRYWFDREWYYENSYVTGVSEGEKWRSKTLACPWTIRVTPKKHIVVGYKDRTYGVYTFPINPDAPVSQTVFETY